MTKEDQEKSRFTLQEFSSTPPFDLAVRTIKSNLDNIRQKGSGNDKHISQKG